MAVRDYSAGKPLTHFVEDSSILERSFGGGTSPQKKKRCRLSMEKSSWSAKQRDFYNGERRFIFGTKDFVKGERWINAINHAVLNYKEPQPLSSQRRANRAKAANEDIEKTASDIEDRLLEQQKAIDDLT